MKWLTKAPLEKAVIYFLLFVCIILLILTLTL